MAPSLLSKLGVCVLVLASGLASDAQEAGSDRQELVLESGPLNFDGSTNLFQAKAPRIRQGDLQIAADDLVATGVEFDASSEWRFKGNVRIEAGSTVMNADSAVFTFQEERLARGELEGAPASFVHLDPEQKPASGTAGKIFYDNVARTLRLTGDILFQRDQTEWQGCDISYNLTTQGFSSGDAACGIRMRRIVPDEPDRQDDGTPPQ
jgi:lipopolysaccharide transport protein LptA